MHDGLTAVSFDMLFFFSAVLSHYSEAKHNVSVLFMYRLLLFKKKNKNNDDIWDTAAILSQKADAAVLLVLPVACWALAAGRQRCFCLSSESVCKMGSVGQDADHITVVFLMDLRTGACGGQVWLLRGKGVCPISRW